tara:strand:- start:1007 stop:1282 length:276 start_codon:yes stop_codon:yes gene_type:complete
MIFTPEQLPQGGEIKGGQRTILFSNGDSRVNLFCRATNKGNLKIKAAERYDYNEETQQWDITHELGTLEGIEEFGHKKVLNPLTGRAGNLI